MIRSIKSLKRLTREAKKTYKNLSIIAGLLLIWIAITDALTDQRTRQKAVTDKTADLTDREETATAVTEETVTTIEMDRDVMVSLVTTKDPASQE